ncbi:hypothetical protein BpHYR1_012765 [Brachionus plicatilis]|uniref:Uncharacterized protein n=1 Tax=Brachionus plicatilis TaxID=10195 RepID=A0A3M7STN0_BRAPC|nr:hypothetical protein BpHYR1_012765 [Brachionus plicatilis]
MMLLALKKEKFKFQAQFTIQIMFHTFHSQRIRLKMLKPKAYLIYLKLNIVFNFFLSCLVVTPQFLNKIPQMFKFEVTTARLACGGGLLGGHLW